MRLLEEAEHQKLIVTRQILEERLHEVRKDNMLKEQKLLNIRKWKEHTLGEVHELEEEFAAICIYSYIIFIYVYFLILRHVFFDVLIEKDENMF